MAIVYNTAVRTARLQQVINAIDAAPANGQLLLGTAGMALTISTITLVKPCATVSSGILTFSGTPIIDASADATGTAVAATIIDSSGVVIVSGLTVSSGAGADITISTASVTVGDTVTFVSGSFTGN